MHKPIGLSKRLGVAFVVLSAGLGLWWHVANLAPTTSIPNPPLPRPNAYDDFLAAGKLLQDPNALSGAVGHHHSGEQQIDPSAPARVWTHSEKVALVNLNTAAYARVQQGLSHSFLCPRDRRSSTPYGSFRSLGLLLVLNGDVKTENGDEAGAMDCYLKAMTYGAAVPRGTNLVGLGAGRTAQSQARVNMVDAVKRLDAPQLKAVAREMEAVNRLHLPFADVLTEIKWSLVSDHLERMSQGNSYEVLQEYHCLCAEKDQPPKWRALLYTKRGVVKDLMRFMDQLIARSKQPYALRGPVPLAPRDPHYLPGPWDDDSEWVVDLLNQTQNKQMTVAIALRAFYLENSTLPASLSELVPEYLGKVPNDLFARRGKLKYAKKASGYVLYSIGPDGKDDGGRRIQGWREDAELGSYTVNPDSRGDIVSCSALSRGD